MGWFNWIGLIFIAVIMVPNIVFAAAHREGFDNLWQNRTVELLEQVGRFGCIALIIVNIPHTWLGFWFEGAADVYIAVNSLLASAYIAVWAICWKRWPIFRAYALSIIPSVIFIFSGVMLRSLLLLFALLFAICHITISLKNSYAEDAKNQNNRKR